MAVLGRYEQRLEPSAQMQFLALLLRQPVWITRRLERIAEVRKLHRPKGVLEINVALHTKSDPARIGNPMTRPLFGKRSLVVENDVKK